MVPVYAGVKVLHKSFGSTLPEIVLIVSLLEPVLSELVIEMLLLNDPFMRQIHLIVHACTEHMFARKDSTGVTTEGFVLKQGLVRISLHIFLFFQFILFVYYLFNYFKRKDYFIYSILTHPKRNGHCNFFI